MTISTIPEFPALGDAAFNTKAYAFGTHMATTFVDEANALEIASALEAQSAATAAASSAAAASTAKDLAITAWAASTAPAETLAAVSASIHTGTVVKAIVYDTSKDSDGGAWRKRCADKSWYTETLGGSRWLSGGYATIALAWAAAGSTTGAIFQATATAGPLTSGKYYSADSATTATEVFRGITREFPAVVAIVAETARVVIYDLTATGTPMWMVFSTTANYALNSGTITSVAALNGRVVVGMSTQEIELGFVADAAYKRNATNYTVNSLPLSGRNTAGVFNVINTTAIIVNAAVNDVALTVLDTAPIDPATGLPVPTIAVATAGGVSVIKDDGTVLNFSDAALPNSRIYLSAYITPDKRLITFSQTNGAVHVFTSCTVAGKTATDYKYDAAGATSTSRPATLVGGATTKLIQAPNRVALSATTGLSLVHENPATSGLGLDVNITNAYNSGWMPGDIRGAHLADTVAGSIAGSGELVTNGTFDTDTTGWTGVSGGVPSVVAGELLVTAGTALNGGAYQALTTVVGKTYVVTHTTRKGTGTDARIRVGTSPDAVDLISYFNSSATNVTATNYFVATGTTTYLTCTAFGAVIGYTAYFDNISVKLAEPDRSVKNKGLVINGTLTKTAVATGASLVAYSGFSASNYLEQPYNSDLDLSTTGFSGVLWLTEAPNSAIEYLINRDSPTPAAAIRLWVSVAGFLVFELYDGTTTRTATGTVAIDDSTRKCVMFDYSAGTLNIYVNNVLYATATGAALLTLNNAAATLRIGESKAGSQPLTNGSIALVRLSATVMSADQREHIYRTELPLFQASAKCIIDGTSTAVTALAYDEDTDLLHVGTSWGRSGFKDLLRVDSEATTTGALTSLSASQGVILTGGTSAKVYQPALLLRDELKRKSEARKALGKIPVFFDYTATSSQTAFVVPKGYVAKAVYHNGTLKRETTTGVYWTRSNDGFAETCTLSTGATVSDWISIMCVRA